MSPKPDNGARAFLIALAGIGVVTGIAFGLGLLLNTPPAARLSLDAGGVLAGGVAVAPMLAFLYWFSNSTWAPMVAFRESQIDFFANIGFEFTLFRIAVLSIGAGISEELLFRGVLQTWVAGFTSLTIAIVLTNIVFGALHARTIFYAIIAGLVGVYLGGLFEITGNVLAPIIAHALYDAVALCYVRRSIAQRAALHASSG